jgi:hypothetical protein
LENLASSSITDAEATLSLLSHFQSFLNFKQEQHGGRKKGSRSRVTLSKYNKICNLRFSASCRGISDKEFLNKYPQYNQSQLNRAKKWLDEGRPGLKKKI